MTNTSFAKALEALGAAFPIPLSEVFAQDFSERQKFVLILAAVNALIKEVGGRALGQPREVASDGTGWVILESVKGSSVVFSNSSDADFLVRRGAGTVYWKLPAGSGKMIDIKDDANELYARRSSAGEMALLTYEINGETIA